MQSQDKEHFLSGGGEGWIVSWNLADPDPGKLIARVESNVFSLLKTGTTIVAGDMNGGMHWVNLDSDETVDVQHHRKGVFNIWQEGDFLYALGGDGYISRRPIGEPRNVESIQISHQALRCQCATVDNQVAIGSSDGAIYFFDLLKFELVGKTENAHANSVFTLAYDAQSHRLVSGSRDAQIKVWDSKGQSIKSIAAHMYTVNSLCFNSDGSLLFSGSRDKTIKVWDGHSFELLKVIEGIRDGGHLNSVNSLLWCPDQDYLVSGSDDKSIGIWKIENTAHDII